MSGAPIPIKYRDIVAWQQAMGTPLHPDEVRAVRALDEARAAWEADLRATPTLLDDED